MTTTIWVAFNNWRNSNHGAAYKTPVPDHVPYVPASDLAAAQAEIARLTQRAEKAERKGMQRAISVTVGLLIARKAILAAMPKEGVK